MTEPHRPAVTTAPVVQPSTPVTSPAGPSRPTLQRINHPRHRGRWGLLAVGAVVVIVVSVALFRRGAQAVELGTVAPGIVRVTIDAEGTTRIVHRHVVSAPVAGMLERISVRPGDVVKVDDLLARITPSAPQLYDARAAVQAAERVESMRALVAQARTVATRAELARAQSARDLERTRRLEAAGAMPRQQLEQAELLDAQREAEVNAARSSVRVAAHDLRAAQAALSSGGQGVGTTPRVVRAPMDGVVLSVLQEDEGGVSAGASLLELGDPTSLEVLTDVLTDDAVRLRVPAAASIASGSDTMPARLIRIEPKAFTKRSSLGVDEQRVRLVLAAAPSAGALRRLGDGFRVAVVLETARSRDSVLTVPAGALMRQGGAWAVYAVRDGVARLRPVVIGLRSATTAEVLSGVPSGERVIVFPTDQVREGTRVVPRKAQADAA